VCLGPDLRPEGDVENVCLGPDLRPEGDVENVCLGPDLRPEGDVENVCLGPDLRPEGDVEADMEELENEAQDPRSRGPRCSSAGRQQRYTGRTVEQRYSRTTLQ